MIKDSRNTETDKNIFSWAFTVPSQKYILQMPTCLSVQHHMHTETTFGSCDGQLAFVVIGNGLRNGQPQTGTVYVGGIFTTEETLGKGARRVTAQVGSGICNMDAVSTKFLSHY